MEVTSAIGSTNPVSPKTHDKTSLPTFTQGKMEEFGWSQVDALFDFLRD